jgi:hypothetical protein
MELIEKYLQAVKFWLPTSQQNDIAAELREDIRSEVEEREAELGRALNENEIEALLKQRGRPLLVAEKYLPQRSLIGPVLFPAYLFVLKIVLLCYLIPWIGVWIGLVTFNPQYRAHHLGLAALNDVFVLWINGWVAFTVPTIVFAVLERVKNQDWLANDWSPRKLPKVRDTQHISRANSGFELVFGVIFGIWWLKILWTLIVFDTSGIRVTLAPEWHKFFWAFLALWIANTTLSAVNFARPYWTRPRRGLRAVVNLVSAGVLFFIVKDYAPVLVQAAAMPVDAARVLDKSLNLTIYLSFAIAALICLVLGIVDLWRTARTEPKQIQLSHGIAT